MVGWEGTAAQPPRMGGRADRGRRAGGTRGHVALRAFQEAARPPAAGQARGGERYLP